MGPAKLPKARPVPARPSRHGPEPPLRREPRHGPEPLHATDVGTVLIRGLAARCVIGANAWERRVRQRIVLDLAVTYDMRAAAASDDLADALDYKDLKDRVLAHVQSSSFHLLEALASSVADLTLAHPTARTVEVTVDKPRALTGAQSVAVRLARRREPA